MIRKILLALLIIIFLLLTGLTFGLYWKSKKIISSIADSAERATTQTILPDVAGESAQE